LNRKSKQGREQYAAAGKTPGSSPSRRRIERGEILPIETVPLREASNDAGSRPAAGARGGPMLEKEWKYARLSYLLKAGPERVERFSSRKRFSEKTRLVPEDRARSPLGHEYTRPIQEIRNEKAWEHAMMH
jgi:hypothetical protein